jgi:hypothetical protein
MCVPEGATAEQGVRVVNLTDHCAWCISGGRGVFRFAVKARSDRSPQFLNTALYDSCTAAKPRAAYRHCGAKLNADDYRYAGCGTHASSLRYAWQEAL